MTIQRMMAAALRLGVAAASATTAATGDLPAGQNPTATTNVGWAVQRGDPGGTQYSPLAQIHAANVHRLEPAWVYRTGDATARSNMHVNPVVVDGVMYVTTPSLKTVALDGSTGRERWAFDPARYNERNAVIRLRNRGVTYWKGAGGERIFDFVKDRVYALNAESGQLITSFGKGGYIDLRENLGVDPATVSLEMTSPGAVFKDLLIVGSRVNESYDASPGHIRAYDAATGKLRWVFHTIPQEGEFGHDTWKWVKGENYGGANAWGGITVDEKRGWVFAATGSATDDFYGAFRLGANLFSDSILALDATTGERKWHFQTVHHDLWDYDNPPAPILATITSGGTTRDVVVQLTKMGFTFVLDRDTGASLFPVEEVPVPASTVPGESAWPTQPIPLKPRPLVRQSLTEADLTNISPQSHEYALREFAKYRSGSIYTPPSLQGTLTLPGHLGGSEWHAGSFDPALNVLYVNVNDAPTINRLKPASKSGVPSAPDRYTIEEYTVFTDQNGVPAIAPPWGTLNALDLASGDLLWKVPLGEYPQLVAKGIRNTGSMNFGGAVATAGGVVFIAATADEKFRAFESHSGRVLWEYQLPAGGYATPSVYMVGGREYVAIAAGGGGKNATRSGDAILAFALPETGAATATRPAAGGRDASWIDLFDGSTLNGWAHLNGAHQYTVEDGAIVGRTVERSATQNSFLCSLPEFGDFELELETMVDRVTNQGIQIRTRVRPVESGRGPEYAAGRVFGPQVEVRRFYPGLSTTGLLYGEALGTGWLSSQKKIDEGHHYFVDDGWNTVRVVTTGPRVQTWVNGHAVEDLSLDDVYRTHPSGHICLQLHGMSARELTSPPWAGSGVTPNMPLVSRWRHIRVRPQ
jgi:glucose dehydrogenase